MALQISHIQAVLKKVIAPAIQNQLPKETVLMDKIKKNVGVRIANDKIYVSARTGRHSGIYHVAEGTAPQVGKAKYEQMYADMKYGFGTLELTDQAIEAAKKSDEKALASILKTEIEALKDDFKCDYNRILNGNGSGKLCLANGTGANSTTLTVDSNPAGLDGTEYLAEGMYIQIGSTASNTAQIASINSATQVTLSAGVTWANNDVISKMSHAEPMGLAGIIDDGDNVATIQNIPRASNPWVNAWTYDTATTLAEQNMIDMYLKALRRGGKERVVTMGHDLYIKYGTLMTSMKRSRDTKEILSGGWQGLDFMGGVGVYLDPDCWSGYVQFIDFGSLTIAEMSDPFQWMEADAHGGILQRSPTNRTIWEGTLKYYMNLVALKFKTMARMSAQNSA